MTKKVYAEVHAILSTFTDDCVKLIPKDLLDLINKERDTNYISIIDENKPLHEQRIEKETIAFIAYLKLNFWCKDDEEKQELLDILKTNEQELNIQLSSATSTRALMKLLRNK